MRNDTDALDGRIRDSLGAQAAPAAALVSRRLSEGSLVASVRLGPARDAVLLAAIADRQLADPSLKALVVAPSDKDVAGLKEAFDALGKRLGLSSVAMGRYGLAEEARVSIGSMDTVASRAAAGTLDTDAFGIVALSDIGPLAGAADAAMLKRALGSAQAERRLAAFASDITPAHRALARDLGGELEELELEVRGEKARSAPTRTYEVKADDKLALLLGLLAAEAARPVAVVCSSAEAAAGLASDLTERGLVAVSYAKAARGGSRQGGREATRGRGAPGDVVTLCDADLAERGSSWASLLVNWDLPLEAEPYRARLGLLDTERPEAAVVNFYCDRFRYGLPVIARALGLRLEPETPPAGLLARDGEAGRKPSPVAKAPPVPRAERARRPERAERRAPDKGGPRKHGDDKPYDGRNIRSIQNDIASITGGKPSAAPQGGSPQGGSPQGGSPQGGSQGAPHGDEPRSGKSRGARAKNGRARSPERTAPGPAKGAAKGDRGGRSRPGPQGAPGTQEKGQGQRPRGGGSRRLADPYSMPMEERLRLYRERYAASGEPGKAPEPKRPSQDRRRGDAAKGDAAKGDVPRGGGTTSDAVGRSGAPRERDAATARDGSEARNDREGKAGLLGVLRGLFGKKDS